MFENLLSEGGISLDRLKNFCLVAENGGIARACDGDPSRQALMSRQISELETFFGTELTRRKGKGIELTDAGAQTGPYGGAERLVMVDNDKRGRVLGIEFIGRKELNIAELLRDMPLSVPKSTLDRARYVAADLAGKG